MSEDRIVDGFRRGTSLSSERQGQMRQVQSGVLVNSATTLLSVRESYVASADAGRTYVLRPVLQGTDTFSAWL